MSLLDITVDGAEQLAAAFAEAAKVTAPSLVPVVRDEAEKLQRQWRSNARKTAGRHGRLYPSSITTELSLSGGALDADVGPDASRPQGGMGRGFEYGSANQPPHMDGARALAVRAPKFLTAVERHVDDIIGKLL